jgi:hypothetical protein
MSDTNDGRGEEFSDPTAPASSEPPPAPSGTPPSTEPPLTPPSQPTDPRPDAGSGPWAPDLAGQQPQPYAENPYGQPAPQQPYADQPYAPPYADHPYAQQQPSAPQYPSQPYAEQQGYAPQYPEQQQYPGYLPSPYAAPGSYGQPPRSNVSALALTVISGISAVFCCLLAAPALGFGIVALTRQSSDPDGSARMTRYGWIAFAVAAALGVLAVAIFVLLTVAGGFDESGSLDGF